MGRQDPEKGALTTLRKGVCSGLDELRAASGPGSKEFTGAQLCSSCGLQPPTHSLTPMMIWGSAHGTGPSHCRGDISTAHSPSKGAGAAVGTRHNIGGTTAHFQVHHSQYSALQAQSQKAPSPDSSPAPCCDPNPTASVCCDTQDLGQGAGRRYGSLQAEGRGSAKSPRTASESSGGCVNSEVSGLANDTNPHHHQSAPPVPLSPIGPSAEDSGQAPFGIWPKTRQDSLAGPGPITRTLLPSTKCYSHWLRLGCTIALGCPLIQPFGGRRQCGRRTRSPHSGRGRVGSAPSNPSLNPAVPLF